MSTGSRDPSPGKHAPRKGSNVVIEHSALHAEVRFATTWGDPSKQRWLAQLLLSWLFHYPSELPVEFTFVLAEVHRRLDAFCRLPWVPFIYRRITAELSLVLAADPERLAKIASQRPDSPELVIPLTRISGSVVEDRVFRSMRTRYLQAVALGSIVIRFSSVDARIERHLRKIQVPRVRGYRDKGSLRSADKWLPPPPSQEEGYPEEDTKQRDLEDFLLRRDE